MRTLTLTLTSDDGKLVAQSQRPWPESNKGIFVLSFMVEELEHRLDVLEREGPWKPQHIDAIPFPEEDYKLHVEQSDTPATPTQT